MMDLSVFKKLTIGGVALNQLFINGIQAWKSGPKNWVPYSTESDGVTIYNGGLGYKSGYRVRSAGEETENSGSSCTGFIPVNDGDVIRVSGCEWTSGYGSAFNAIDANFESIGQVVGNGGNGYYAFSTAGVWKDYGIETVIQKEGYYEWTVPPETGSLKCAYIRVTGAVSDGSQLVVTINERLDTVVDINQVGYAENARWSTSDGTIRTGATGIIAVNLISFEREDGETVTVTLSGIDWAYNTNCTMALFADATFKSGAYLNAGTSSDTTAQAQGYRVTLMGDGVVKVEFFDAANSSYAGINGFKVSGYGSAGDAVITIS